MVEAWRVVKTRYSTNAFDGEGARINGGRWNSVNVRMVYTAWSLSLATMEIMVLLDQSLARLRYSEIRVEIEEGHITGPPPLPNNWAHHSNDALLKSISDTWVAQRSSLVLKVPSSVVPRESCYLINPMHPDFPKLKIYPPAPLSVDLTRFAI